MVRVRVSQLAKCAACLVKRAHLPNAPYRLGFCLQISRKIYYLKRKKKYVEILSNVDLQIERSIRIILMDYAYINLWSLPKDCGFVLKTANLDSVQ